MDLEIEFHRAMQIIVLGATVVVATIPSYLYQDKLMIALTFVLIFGTIIVAQIAGVNDYKRTLKATV